RELLRFFFQAEDGIRDFHVTGVQTCALPIYLVRHDRAGRRIMGYADAALEGEQLEAGPVSQNRDIELAERLGDVVAATGRLQAEIGRASCRERGGAEVGAGPGREMVERCTAR